MSIVHLQDNAWIGALHLAREAAVCGDPKAMRKLQGVQALAYRLLGDESITGRAGPSYAGNPRPSHAIPVAKWGRGC